jgi:hypothetical protein
MGDLIAQLLLWYCTISSIVTKNGQEPQSGPTAVTTPGVLSGKKMDCGPEGPSYYTRTLVER